MNVVIFVIYYRITDFGGSKHLYDTQQHMTKGMGTFLYMVNNKINNKAHSIMFLYFCYFILGTRNSFRFRTIWQRD